MNKLLELAERVENSQGPDDQLDLEISRALFGERDQFGYYTASIDAAMTLVPEGWHLSALCEDWRTGKWHARLMRRATPAQIATFGAGEVIARQDVAAKASTAANAITAAALRARAAQGVEPRAG